jgi:hypothetical protein
MRYPDPSFVNGCSTKFAFFQGFPGSQLRFAERQSRVRRADRDPVLFFYEVGIAFDAVFEYFLARFIALQGFELARFGGRADHLREELLLVDPLGARRRRAGFSRSFEGRLRRRREQRRERAQWKVLRRVVDFSFACAELVRASMQTAMIVAAASRRISTPVVRDCAFCGGDSI